MTGRNGREMEVLLVKLDEQIGPLEKWSAEALAVLDLWLTDLHLDINEDMDGREDWSA